MTHTRARAGRYRRRRVFWSKGYESTTEHTPIVWIDLCNGILKIAVATWIPCAVTRSNTTRTVHNVRVRNVLTAGQKTILWGINMDCDQIATREVSAAVDLINRACRVGVVRATSKTSWTRWNAHNRCRGRCNS